MLVLWCGSRIYKVNKNLAGYCLNDKISARFNCSATSHAVKPVSFLTKSTICELLRQEIITGHAILTSMSCRIQHLAKPSQHRHVHLHTRRGKLCTAGGPRCLVQLRWVSILCAVETPAASILGVSSTHPIGVQHTVAERHCCPYISS